MLEEITFFLFQHWCTTLTNAQIITLFQTCHYSKALVFSSFLMIAQLVWSVTPILLALWTFTHTVCANNFCFLTKNSKFSLILAQLICTCRNLLLFSCPAFPRTLACWEVDSGKTRGFLAPSDTILHSKWTKKLLYRHVKRLKRQPSCVEAYRQL